ncbi:ryanodine receptor [Caerostris extrusa]|uniref:Ryanodine receptor n=1 Tax=Caerostris extrusa TaxID=172846 RepID=A0AAV4UNE2_CAEEX|nr:ryanodine receptor [Caerostris extrusa]
MDKKKQTGSRCVYTRDEHCKFLGRKILMLGLKRKTQDTNCSYALNRELYSQDDMVCLQCTATEKRVCLAAEGFGNRHCFLENIADKNTPPEMSSCVFVIEQALSVRAFTRDGHSHVFESGKSTQSGHRTLLYGHAVLLRHQNSNMYLACLSTSSSNDKLAFDVGLQEHSQGEACWWTIHPASKQRSEGEKVRVGDDLILVSVATERYLHTAREGTETIVNASFHLTHWSVAPFGTGSSRVKSVACLYDTASGVMYNARTERRKNMDKNIIAYSNVRGRHNDLKVVVYNNDEMLYNVVVYVYKCPRSKKPGVYQDHYKVGGKDIRLEKPAYKQFSNFPHVNVVCDTVSIYVSLNVY